MNKFLVFMVFLSCMFICDSQEMGNVKYLVARWCYESEKKPLANSAPSNFEKDNLEMEGNVNIENGIVKFSSKSSGLLKLNSNKDFNSEIGSTYWMRSLIPLPYETGNSSYNTKDTISLLRNGPLTIKCEIKYNEGSGPTFQIIGTYAREKTVTTFDPGMSANLRVGLWFQVALSIEKDRDEQIFRLYYRAENSSFSSKAVEKNFWVYIGKFEIDKNEFKNVSPTIFGDRLNANRGINDLWFDEARVYKKKMELVELYRIGPSLKDIPEMSENPPGIVIDYSPSYSGRYIAGSPAIVVMDDGTYIAKGDDYGPAVGKSELVRIYKSDNKGKNWKQISEIEGMTWASLFLHQGGLYMLGTSAGHGLGHAIIIKSLDGGITWTQPMDTHNGIIFSDLSYHTAPGPVVVHNGRIWKAMEDEKGIGGWGTNFRAFLMSAPVNSDLLLANSWKTSDALPYDPDWLNGTFNGWLEGNAVVAPNGKMVNVLRVSMKKGGGKAAIISYSDDGKKSYFDPDKDFVNFPGGSTKFFIQYDKKSKLYWALSNAVPEKHNSSLYTQALIRNTLVLMSSSNLYDWTIKEVLLYHPEIAQHAFQYPTFAIDGDDIVYVSRTAYDDSYGGAVKQHDVNYLTFHRIENFRNRYSN